MSLNNAISWCKTKLSFYRRESVKENIAVAITSGLAILIITFLFSSDVQAIVKTTLMCTYNVMRDSYPTYGWVLALSAGAIAYTLYDLIRRDRTPKLSTSQLVQGNGEHLSSDLVGHTNFSESVSEPDYIGYTHDNFFGLTWHWEWSNAARYRVSVDNTNYGFLLTLPLQCPNCSSDLNYIEHISLRNFNCQNILCLWVYDGSVLRRGLDRQENFQYLMAQATLQIQSNVRKGLYKNSDS